MIKIREEKSIVMLDDYNKKSYEKDIIVHVLGDNKQHSKTIVRTIKLYKDYIYDEENKTFSYKKDGSAIFHKTEYAYKFITNVDSKDQIEIYRGDYDYKKDSLIFIRDLNNKTYTIRYYNFTTKKMTKMTIKDKHLNKKLTRIKTKNKH